MEVVIITAATVAILVILGEIASQMMRLEERIERLENNPKVFPKPADK